MDTKQLTTNTSDISLNKFSWINSHEIINAIKSLKDDSSPELDGVSLKLLLSLIKSLSTF